MDSSSGRKNSQWRKSSSAAKRNSQYAGAFVMPETSPTEETPKEVKKGWRVSQAAIQAKRVSVVPKSAATSEKKGEEEEKEEEEEEEKDTTVAEPDTPGDSRSGSIGSRNPSLSVPSESRKPSLFIPALRKGSEARWSRISEMSKMSEMSSPLDMPSFPAPPGTADDSAESAPTLEDGGKTVKVVIPKRTSYRHSISTPSFKTDFNVPVVADAVVDDDKRKSRRLSLMTEFAQLERERSEKERRKSNRMSVLTDHSVPDVMDRRASRRLSTLSDMSAEIQPGRRESNTRRESLGGKRYSTISINDDPPVADAVDRQYARQSRVLGNDWVQRVEDEEPAVPVDWSKDKQNARNWRVQVKVSNTIAISLGAFATSLAATMYAPAREKVVQKLDTTNFLSILPYALFFLGLALGPVIAVPAADSLGRKFVYLAGLVVSACFILGSGLSDTIGVLAVCRFLAGASASTTFFLGLEMLSDIWSSTYNSLPVLLYVLSLFLGLPVGTLAGAVVTQHLSWKVTQWISLVCLVIVFLAALIMTESHKNTLFRRRETRQWIEERERAMETEHPDDEQPVRPATNYPRNPRAAMKMVFVLPFRLLAAEPLAFLLTLGVSLGYAVLSAFFAVIPERLGAVYGFKVASQGYTFAGMVIAIAIAFGGSFLMEKFFYAPRYARWVLEHPIPVDEPENNEKEETDAEKRKSYVTAATKRKSSVISVNSVKKANNRKSYAGIKGLNELSEEDDIPAMPVNNALTIATAVCDYLKSKPKNARKKIIPDRIITTLTTLPKYGDIADTLENMGYRLDRSELAKVLADSMVDIEDEYQPPVARSRSLHLAAAEAMLMGGDSGPVPMPPVHDEKKTVMVSTETPVESPLASPASAASSNGSVTKLVKNIHSRSTAPPAEWRLLPALPASIIGPAALFMMAWTFDSSITWVVPVIGMSAFAGCAMLTFTSALGYINERFSPARNADDEEFAAASNLATGARAGATFIICVLSAGFPLFSNAMYNALDVKIATTVFGGVMAAAGVVPWLVVFMGKKRNHAVADMS